MSVLKVCLDSGALFVSDQLKTVAETFKEGIIVFNRGKIHVILDADLHSRILVSRIKEQQLAKDFDVPSTMYLKFLMHCDDEGKTRVLPENVYFTDIFHCVAKAIESCKGTISVSLKELEANRKCQDASIRRYRDFSLQKSKTFRQKVYVPEDNFLVYMLRTVENKLVTYPTDDTLTQQGEQSIAAQERRPESNSENVQRGELTDHVVVTNPEQDSVHRSVLTYDYNRSTLSSHNIVTSQTSLSTPMNFPRAERNNPLPGVRPRYPDYISFDDRFISYSNLWPHVSPSPHQLAKAGFFFRNDGDLVRCFQCGIGLKDFSEGDDPLLEHVRHSLQCPYLRQILSTERHNSIQTRLQASDPEFHRQLQLYAGQARFPSIRYRHPEYQTLEARLATYRGWPVEASQTPEQLTEAGLYYTGVEDHVRCFACDGGLRRWDPEDDPWTEHCRWFPGCPFCIEQKGEEYIALVQASVDQQDENGASRGELENQMQRLTLEKAKAELQTFYDTNNIILTDMGFVEAVVNEAVHELRNRGTSEPGIEEVVDMIQIIKERREAENVSMAVRTDNPLEENLRLKEVLVCNQCQRNSVNALFLPCTHHTLCMKCAAPLSSCPVCDRAIRERIRTSMA